MSLHFLILYSIFVLELEILLKKHLFFYLICCNGLNFGPKIVGSVQVWFQKMKTDFLFQNSWKKIFIVNQNFKNRFQTKGLQEYDFLLTSNVHISANFDHRLLRVVWKKSVCAWVLPFHFELNFRGKKRQF